MADPFQTVVPAEAFPTPPISQLAPMTLFDVHCGKYRKVMFWDWMKVHLPHYALPALHAEQQQPAA